MNVFIFQFRNWLEEVRVQIGPSAYNTGINGITTTRNNLQWSANRIEEFVMFFESGYVPDVLPPLEIGSVLPHPS